MRCPGCAKNVNDNLPDLDGVTSAAADHDRGVVDITHIPAVAAEDQIRDHIRELGYEVTGHAIQQERQLAHERHIGRRLTRALGLRLSPATEDLDSSLGGTLCSDEWFSRLWPGTARLRASGLRRTAG